ncbi:MAG: hypothetical protein ACRCZB_07380 [Bacteroidales bacterium]
MTAILTYVGLFSFVFAVFTAIIGVVVFVTRFTTKITVEHGHFVKSLDRIDGNMGKIQLNLEKVKDDITQLKIIVGGFSKESDLAKSFSPLALTEKGIKLSEKLRIKERIVANWDKIKAYIDANVLDKNPYDIQVFCVEMATVKLINFFSEQDIKDLKLLAFNEGKPVESYGNLIGLEIRDIYFKHIGISIKEIDSHDPTKNL